jgi:hypothetical protein
MSAAAQDEDLLIIARERVVVPRFSQMAASVEIRLDSRRMERRRVPAGISAEERRRRDRRALDVSDQLRAAGWVFIPAAQRGVPPPPVDVAPVSDPVDDERAVRERLGAALLCSACIARASGVPLHRVETVLEQQQRAARIRMLGARCEECRKTTLVYALD